MKNSGGAKSPGSHVVYEAMFVVLVAAFGWTKVCDLVDSTCPCISTTCTSISEYLDPVEEGKEKPKCPRIEFSDLVDFVDAPMSKRKSELIRTEISSFATQLTTELTKSIKGMKEEYLSTWNLQVENKTEEKEEEPDYESCVLILQKDKASHSVFQLDSSDDIDKNSGWLLLIGKAIKPLLESNSSLLDDCFLLTLPMAASFTHSMDRCAALNENWELAELNTDCVHYSFDWDSPCCLSPARSVFMDEEVDWIEVKENEENLEIKADPIKSKALDTLKHWKSVTASCLPKSLMTALQEHALELAEEYERFDRDNLDWGDWDDYVQHKGKESFYLHIFVWSQQNQLK